MATIFEFSVFSVEPLSKTNITPAAGRKRCQMIGANMLFSFERKVAVYKPSKRVQQRIGNRDVGQTLREGGLAYSQKRERKKDTQWSEFTNLGFAGRFARKVFGSENSGRQVWIVGRVRRCTPKKA